MPQTKYTKRIKVLTERQAQIEAQKNWNQRFPSVENDEKLARLIRDCDSIQAALDRRY